MVGALFIVAALGYVIASAFALRSLTQDEESARKHALYSLAGAVVLHGVYLIADLTQGSQMSAVHQTLTGVSFGLVLAYFIARNLRPGLDVLSAFITPVVLFFFLGSGLGRNVRHVSEGVRSALLPAHIGVNLVGLIAFGLSFAAALAYLLQERALRQKRIGGIVRRLPPLDVLDTFGLRSILVGFPLLTLGIVSGAFWAFRLEEVQLQSTHVFAIIAWVLFGSVLLLRLAAGWRGRRAAYGTIVGFLCTCAVVIGYLLRGASA